MKTLKLIPLLMELAPAPKQRVQDRALSAPVPPNKEVQEQPKHKVTEGLLRSCRETSWSSCSSSLVSPYPAQTRRLPWGIFVHLSFKQTRQPINP